MGRRIVLVQLQRGLETFGRVVQTVQFEKDVSKVDQCSDAVRLQYARGTVPADPIIETTLLMVQLRKQIHPAKLVWGYSIGIQITLAGRGRERVDVIDLTETTVRVAECCFCRCGKRGSSRCDLIANARFQV